MIGLELQEINIDNKEELLEIIEFLRGFNLKYEDDIEYTIVAKKNNKIIGTCSRAQKVLKCFAVLEDYRGEGVSAIMVSHMINDMFTRGIYHSFVFTGTYNKEIFISLGYNLLMESEGVIFLEQGMYTIKDTMNRLIREYSINIKEPKAALVMNCNPFTKGHRYIIEQASKENNEVLVFILDEEKSAFSFKDRYHMVKEGTKDLKNIKVIPGGEYIISYSTFPSYFLKQEDQRLIAYTKIDAGLFGKYISKILNITKRYVGTEPYCTVTRTYNENLKKVLASYGVSVIELTRLKKDQYYISASRVRELLKEGKTEEAFKLVPKATQDYLSKLYGIK